MKKVCKTCGVPKELEDGFYRNSGMADGYQSSCQECAKAAQKVFYYKNHDHYRAYDKARQQTEERKKNHRFYDAKRKKRLIREREQAALAMAGAGAQGSNEPALQGCS